MKVVLLRIGINTGSGGIHGPLFADRTFEYIPIPDRHSVDKRTYGNTAGRRGQIDQLFPAFRARADERPADARRSGVRNVHVWRPDRAESRIAVLAARRSPALLLRFARMGFRLRRGSLSYGLLRGQARGRAAEFRNSELDALFSRNFHVRHRSVFRKQSESLVLVKGTSKSRLLENPVQISANGKDRAGKMLKVLSPEMRHIFGDFDGRVSIQRSPPRWVAPAFIANSAEFVRSLGRKDCPPTASRHVLLGRKRAACRQEET